MPNNLLFTKQDHIARITLNRPETGNLMGLPMAQELIEVCSQINADPDIRVVILCGSGTSFCIGGNAHGLDNPAGDHGLNSAESPAEAIAGIGCPSLAAINGESLGLGLELALACDLRIASDNAKLGLPQITRGQIPVDGGTQRLSRLVGKAKALEMLLTGEIIDAVAAFEIGLINKIVSPQTLPAEVENLAKTIAAKAPLAVRYSKEAVNKGLDQPLDQGLRLEADLYFLLHTTSDRTEGVRSFLEKRPPNYKGQ